MRQGVRGQGSKTGGEGARELDRERGGEAGSRVSNVEMVHWWEGTFVGGHKCRRREGAASHPSLPRPQQVLVTNKNFQLRTLLPILSISFSDPTFMFTLASPLYDVIKLFSITGGGDPKT